MSDMILNIFYILMLIIALSLLFYNINKKEFWDKNSSSTFECGFNSFSFIRHCFSIHYFFVGLLFLFLDLEFCIMLPYLFESLMNWKMIIQMLIILNFILISIMVELLFKSFNWKF